jgi:isoquinoline 1-oxidoreductase alpha subunit
MSELRINGVWRGVDVPAEKPMLWTLREDLGLLGTKYGCGIGVCGACTIHVDGHAVRSCSMPSADAKDKVIVTIEGLGSDKLHPVQAAWIELQVPQCGYCQPGFIMAAAALLARNPRPTDAEIDAELTNICRCGTYEQIRKAIHRAAELIGQGV